MEDYFQKYKISTDCDIDIFCYYIFFLIIP